MSKLTRKQLEELIHKKLMETSIASTNPRSARSASMPPRARNQADQRNPADEEVLSEEVGETEEFEAEEASGGDAVAMADPPDESEIEDYRPELPAERPPAEPDR